MRRFVHPITPVLILVLLAVAVIIPLRKGGFELIAEVPLPALVGIGLLFGALVVWTVMWLPGRR